jgi:cytochrome c-type biogenesis protein CcmF
MTPSVPELGHFALALAVAFGFAQAILPLWGAQRRDARLIAAAPAIAIGQFIALAASFASLVYCAVSDDFSVLNIAENSHTLKPLLYKISGVWGDHEGSILLWCLVLSACGAAVAIFGGRLPAALRARVLGVLGLSSCGFQLFCLLESNPFVRLWPAPVEGRDMNPLLQDPGLAFHPPMLYLGYVGMAIPFAFAVAALIEGRVDAAWGRWVRPWTLAAWCCLTGGIALGSWWSYYQLGWGGFWFWDPVENASLLPWLTGTALLHSAIVVEKREALRIWTVLLAIGTFSLSLSGTFLVRSGILNSVHSFAQDPARGVFILALLALVIGGSLLLFALRAPVLSSSGIFAPISREGGLVLNNVLLCSIAAVVMTGTTFPLFANLLTGQNLSFGPPFFDATVLPLAVPVFAVMSVGPLLPWKRAALWPAVRKLWWAALVALAVAAAASLRARLLPCLCFAAAAWLVAGALTDVATRVQLFRISPGASLRRLAGLRRGSFGAPVAHAGLGVTIAGIAGMTLSIDRVVLLHPGESVRIAGYSWTLDGVTDAPGPNFEAREARIVVRHGDHVVTVLRPELRRFPVQQVTTNEARIHTNLFRDLYAVLGDERDGGAVLRLHWNFLAPWIWLGALVMALGGLLSLSDRRLRIGAPARAAPARPSAPVVLPAE